MPEEAQSSLPTNEGSTSEPGMTLVNMHVPFPDTFVYSNCSAFSVSQMDIRISFAEALPNRTAQARGSYCPQNMQLCSSDTSLARSTSTSKPLVRSVLRNGNPRRKKQFENCWRQE